MKHNLSRAPSDRQGGNQFYLDIRFDQNSTLQGKVQRLDTGEQIHFRSILELLSLIETASRDQNNCGEESKQLRNWKITDQSTYIEQEA